MSNRLSERDHKFLIASNASEKIISRRAAANGSQNRSFTTIDPATGALIIDPAFDDKIRQALRRKARRIALRFYLRYLRFQIEYLALKARYASLRIRRHLACKLIELRVNVHRLFRS